MPAAPVVVFSSSANSTEIKRAIELGVREFVHKPSDLDEFRTAVMKMIQTGADPKIVGLLAVTHDAPTLPATRPFTAPTSETSLPHNSSEY